MNTNCILSSSSLTDNDVKNASGKTLGSIKDIMICTETNDVRYYVLSFGGFMGLGDKLFAIPPQAMQIDTENECFILNVTEDQLEKAEGFDKDNWPNFADPSFNKATYGHYGYDYREAA